VEGNITWLPWQGHWTNYKLILKAIVVIKEKTEKLNSSNNNSKKIHKNGA
jgi:hypothetical protein